MLYTILLLIIAVLLYHLAPTVFVFWLSEKRGQPIEIIILTDGEERALHSYLDSCDGFAGHTFVRREGNKYYAGVKLNNKYRSGPRWGDSLYVDGIRVSPKHDLLVESDQFIVQRRRFEREKSLSYYRVLGLQ